MSDNRESHFVHIIESPDSMDLLDGRTEGEVLAKSLRLAGINMCYNLATNYATFLEALQRVYQAAGDFGGVPVLHISAHGDEDGIALTDGTVLSWDDLRPLCDEMQGSLLIGMSTCQGWEGGRIAMSEDGYPFYALVGNVGDAAWSDSAVAFVALYHRLFQGAEVEDAVEAMRSASGDPNFDCWWGADARESWKQYVEEEGVKELNHRLAAGLGRKPTIPRGPRFRRPGRAFGR